MKRGKRKLPSLSDYIGFVKTEIHIILNRKCSCSAIGIRSTIDHTSAIRQRCRIYDTNIGRYSFVGRNSLLQNVSVGNFCSISEGCLIGLPAHPTDMVSTSPVFLKGSNVLRKNFAVYEFEDTPMTTIESDVWLGANVLIKSGVTIGTGAIVGAGAVVVKDVQPYSIVGGVPAKLLRYRFSDEKIRELLESEWWNMTDEAISMISKDFHSVENFIQNRGIING